MKIYAIIVTYNAMRRNWIEQCMRSLKASTIPVTPIVIDNGSTDETRSYVPQYYPDAVWLPQQRNLGFGQANNIGLRHAIAQQADYVLLLNQDATISPDAIEKMLPFCDNQTLISPLHLNGDGTRLDQSFSYCMTLSCTNFMNDIFVEKKLKAVYEVPQSHIPAACWLLSVDVVMRIGGFNPLFFHYGEDENYFHRLAFHHIRVKVCTQTAMYHDRAEHGNTTMFYKKQCKRLLLSAATNINLSLPRLILEFVKILKNSYAVYLNQKQYRIGDFTVGILWLLANYPKIRSSKTTERNIGLNWL